MVGVEVDDMVLEDEQMREKKIRQQFVSELFYGNNRIWYYVLINKWNDTQNENEINPTEMKLVKAMGWAFVTRTWVKMLERVMGLELG